jgi:hypothetical protein
MDQNMSITKKYIRTFVRCGCALLPILAGCATPLTRPTTGQELIDLKRAYDAAAISKEEYDDRRAMILSGKPAPPDFLAPGSPLNESVRSMTFH